MAQGAVTVFTGRCIHLEGDGTMTTWQTAAEATADDLRADVIVIGSGATGQSVARRLAASGVDVLMVEAGPAKEVHRKSQEVLQAAMPAVNGQYPDFGAHMLMNLGGSIGKPIMPMSSDGSKPADGIRLTRLTEADLVDWPISMADLDPYYDLVGEWFEIDWDDHELPVFDDDRLNTAPFHVVSRSAFSDPTPAHLDGIRVLLEAPVSRLVVGPSGAISAAHVSTRSGEELKLEADRFVLAMNTMPATQLLMHSDAANSSGMLGHYLMDHPLVTFGFIEPAADLPREMLAQLTPKPTDTGLFWPKLIPDQTAVAAGSLVNLAMTLVPLDWTVRRNLMRHRMLKPVVVGARTGAKHSLARVARDVKSRSFDKALLGDAFTTLRGADELLHIKFRPKGPRFNLENGWWADALGDSLPKTYEIAAMVEQRAHSENRVTISDQRNSLGWRKLRVDWSYRQADKDAVDLAATPIIDGLEEAGFGRFTRLAAKDHTENYSCHHASGTIRMSSDPAAGVVDPDCRAHDHDNLFIAGMSVFPSVGFANPTLTSMALGARIADTITHNAITPWGQTLLT